MMRWFVRIWKEIRSPGLLILGILFFSAIIFQISLPASSANIVNKSTTACQDGADTLSVTLQYPRRLAPYGTNLHRLPVYLSIFTTAPKNTLYEVWLYDSEGSLLFSDINGAPIPFPLRVIPGQHAPANLQSVYVQRVERQAQPKSAEVLLELSKGQVQGASAPLTCGSWSETPQIEFIPRDLAAFSLWLESIAESELLSAATILGIVGLLLQQGWKRREALREEKNARLSHISLLKDAIKTSIGEAVAGWDDERKELDLTVSQTDDTSNDSHINRALSTNPEIRIALNSLKEKILSVKWKEPVIYKIFDCYNQSDPEEAEKWLGRYEELARDGEYQASLKPLAAALARIAEWRKNPATAAIENEYKVLCEQYEHFRFYCHRPLADLLAELIKVGQLKPIYDTFSPSPVGQRILLDQSISQAIAEKTAKDGVANPDDSQIVEDIRRISLDYDWEINPLSHAAQQADQGEHAPCGTPSVELDLHFSKSFRFDLPCFTEMVYLRHDIILGEPGCGKTTAALWMLESGQNNEEPQQRIFSVYSSEPPVDPKRWMVNTLAAGLRAFVGRNPVGYLLADPAAQLAIEALLWTEAGSRENLLRSLRSTGIESQIDGEWAARKIVHGAGPLPAAISAQNLAEVLGKALPAQFAAVFLILDLDSSAPDARLSEHLRELISYFPLLARQQVFVKLFAPASSLNFKLPLYMAPIRLDWTAEALMQLIQNWKGTSRDPFSSLLSEAEREERSRQLAAAADGSPRSLVRLANRLCRAGEVDSETFEYILRTG